MDGDRESTLVAPRVSLWPSVRQWWNGVAERQGRFSATRQLLIKIAKFVRDSTPERRRQRYGDAEYDWEHRVNTTSAAVGWHDRLLGIFHSPYQPTDSALFHEMLEALRQPVGDFHDFVFIDLGSGKGRALDGLGLSFSAHPWRGASSCASPDCPGKPEQVSQ